MPETCLSLEKVDVQPSGNRTYIDAEDLAPGSAALGLLDCLPFMTLVIDEHHHILAANRAIRSALGRDSAALVGTWCPRTMHGLDASFPGCPLEAARDRGGQSTERDLADPSCDRTFNSAVYATPFQTRAGTPVYLHTVLDITELRQAQEARDARAAQQRLVGELLQIGLDGADLSAQLTELLRRILAAPGLHTTGAGGILLADPQRPGVLVHAVSQGLDQQVLALCPEVRFGECVCGRAAERRAAVTLAHATADLHERSIPGMPDHGHACVPMLGGDTVVGVLNVYLEPGVELPDDQLAFLQACARVVAQVVERRRAETRAADTVRVLHTNMRLTAAALSGVVEARDPYTAGHQRRVAELARAIGRRLGMDDHRLEGLHLGGLIHDLGKVAVPAEILAKPGRLSPIELSLIQNHAQLGYELLRDLPFAWPVAAMAWQHHERWDGTGYPGHLVGEQIIEEARILAVADVVEAIASHRPYRPSKGLGYALEEVERQRGRHFSPEVADACLAVFWEDGFQLPA